MKLYAVYYSTALSRGRIKFDEVWSFSGLYDSEKAAEAEKQRIEAIPHHYHHGAHAAKIRECACDRLPTFCPYCGGADRAVYGAPVPQCTVIDPHAPAREVAFCEASRRAGRAVRYDEILEFCRPENRSHYAEILS